MLSTPATLRVAGVFLYAAEVMFQTGTAHAARLFVIAQGCLAILVLGLCGGCQSETDTMPFTVVSWSGSDGAPVPLDQDLTIEFNQPITTPLRQSSIEILDEAGLAVQGMRASVAGSWLRLRPTLPRQPTLQDGSLLPDRRYQIRLFGLPRLAAITSTHGGVLASELALPFRTAAAKDPGALLGSGAEFSAISLIDAQRGERLAFSANAPVILLFRGGLDPRSLTGVATLKSQADQKSLPCRMRLLSNDLDSAQLEILVENWSGWGVLTLPEEMEGLGGWPLLESSRVLRLHRAAQ